MRNRRAIIFEDDDVIRDFYRQLFALKDYEVLAFAEPSACPIYRDNAPSCKQQYPCADIMITDYQMPGMNGLDLLETQLRRGCKLTMKNKALISGFINEEKIRRMDILGCASFHKPVSIDTLFRWMAECEQRIDLSQPIAMQRKESRLAGQQGTHCEVALNNDTIPCRALNISQSGYCLELPVPLAAEQVVRISTHTPIMSREALVRWVAKKENGQYLAGLCST